MNVWRKKAMGILAGIVCSVLIIHAQSPYQLGRRDPALLALVGGMSIAGHLQSMRPLPGAFPSLDIRSVPFFDRFAVYNWSVPAQKASDGMVMASGLAAGSLLLHKDVRSNLWPILVMGAESMLLSDGMVSLAKPLALRPRPYMYSNFAPLEYRQRKDARFSFFSGHTTYSSTLSFFTAKVIHDLHPDAKWRKWVWVGAAIVPAATGSLRILGGKHFLSDVLVGYAVGAASGILVPHLHKRPSWTGSGRTRLPSFYAAGSQLGVLWTF